MEKKEEESLDDVILRLSTKNLCIEDVVGTQILSRADWDEVKLELKKADVAHFKRIEGLRVEEW